MSEQSFSTKNYSMEANYQALENLVASNPDLWTDKYLLGTGAQLLRIISAGQSANGVRTLQALYESMIGYMQRRDSLLGFAETMGYSAFRGSNDIIQLVVTATETVSIPARNIVGSVQNVDLVNIDPLVMNAGQTYVFNAKVGNLNIVTRNITDTEYKYIRFINDSISNDILLFRNDIQIDYLTAYRNAFQDGSDLNFVMLTNAYGGVDIFFIDKGSSNPVTASDTFTINYIEYTNINYTQNDINFLYGTIEQASTVETGTIPESNESLRVNIPYFRDTQREVLANRDPIKLLSLLLPGVQSTSGTNLNSVHSLLSYKYADYHLITDEQLKTYEPELAPNYYFGFCPSNIVQPIQYQTPLDIEIVLNNPRVDLTNIRELVTNVIKQYEYLPKVSSIGFTESIDLDDMESELNKLQINDEYVVKTAYVNLTVTPFTDTERLFLGKTYSQGDTLVRLKNFNFDSGSSLPTDFTEQYTPSGQVLLEKWRLIYGYTDLEPNTYYKTDDIVGTNNTTIFRVHPNYTLPSQQPEWNTTLGGYTYQDDLVWLTIESVPGTSYNIGDYAIKGMIVTPQDSEVSYQLIAFTKVVDSLDSPELITETVITTQRKIYNLWNSYTVFSIGSLNIHV